MHIAIQPVKKRREPAVVHAHSIRTWARAARALFGAALCLAAAHPAAAQSLVPGARIELPSVTGRLDHLDIDTEGQRRFVAALGAHSVEVIDLAAGRRIARLQPLPGTQGVAYWPASKRLFVANDGGGSVQAFAEGKGPVVATANCGEGQVQVIRQRDADHYEVAERVTTAPGARTGLFVPASSSLYVAVPPSRRRASRSPCLPHPAAHPGRNETTMSPRDQPRLAILYPGDRAARDRANPKESRFLKLFDAFAGAGVAAEPAVYHDDFHDQVLQQLLRVQGVLVWHNPVEGGRDRRQLDTMLRQVAASGVFVSTHPDTILKLGTKDVLLAVRDLPFGCDVQRVDSLAQAQAELPARLALGARVLKQHRGHSGIGIWRIEQQGLDRYAIRHAARGAMEETVPLDGVLQRIAPYFEHAGHMIDQAWQPRMVEGMTRAYLVQGRVAGFGHQAVVALHPPPDGGDPPPPSQRLYSDANDPRFQALRRRLEGEWLAPLCSRVGLRPEDLPMLWDADFLLGERMAQGEEKYVLCEINVSSVSPFPDAAIQSLVDASCRLLAAV